MYWVAMGAIHQIAVLPVYRHLGDLLAILAQLTVMGAKPDYTCNDEMVAFGIPIFPQQEIDRWTAWMYHSEKRGSAWLARR